VFATAQEPGSEVQEENHAGARHPSIIGAQSLGQQPVAEEERRGGQEKYRRQARRALSEQQQGKV
jgi:hypothetical protein